MEQLIREGLVAIPPGGEVPRFKRFLDESKGLPIGSVWDDINPINSQAKESLGYPTQKPISLLERIVKSSSNENDIVLDAFCGCGTALISAQSLKRQWIGIDISPTACRVVAKRLQDTCKINEDESLWRLGKGFIVRGLPWTEEKLRDLPPFEFENWAVIAVGGIANKIQVGDMGIDGRIFPSHATPKKQKDSFDAFNVWYAIQVKQKDKVGRPDIDAFEAAILRDEHCIKGIFVSFDYSSDAKQEVESFFKRTQKVISLLTVKDILEEHIAMKLA
jgi:hypothetical protein